MHAAMQVMKDGPQTHTHMRVYVRMHVTHGILQGSVELLQ